ncbi:MAG: SDR family oxidoreductase [Chloroflexi bacterium]|nr:SDR family oxidoreductase [Chloroflexota bacterium]
MEDLTGTVAVVTGASSGIGRATARDLLGAGARVVIGARRRERLEEVEAEFPDRVAAVEIDVRSPDDCRRLVGTAMSRFGRLDSLIANAGIGMYGGILDQTDEALATMLDTNVAGTVWPIRAAVPAMIEAGHGDIVIVASVAGFRPVAGRRRRSDDFRAMVRPGGKRKDYPRELASRLVSVRKRPRRVRATGTWIGRRCRSSISTSSSRFSSRRTSSSSS